MDVVRSPNSRWNSNACAWQPKNCAQIQYKKFRKWICFLHKSFDRYRNTQKAHIPFQMLANQCGITLSHVLIVKGIRLSLFHFMKTNYRLFSAFLFLDLSNEILLIHFYFWVDKSERRKIQNRFKLMKMTESCWWCYSIFVSTFARLHVYLIDNKN